MSWSSAARHRRLFALGLAVAAPVLLGGCGFHPLYADQDPDKPIAADLASVYVAQIADRTGQEMTNKLRDDFNPTGVSVSHAYQLEIALQQRKADLMIREDATAARTNVSLTANWTLRRLSDHKVVAQGTESSVTGFDVLDNEYANVVSANTTLSLAVRDVSDIIETRVALYLRNPVTPEAKPASKS